MVDYVFDRNPARKLVARKRYEALRQTLICLYRTGSTYQHTPAPKDSTVVIGGGMPGAGSIGFTYALADLNAHLRFVCYTYVLNFPMCLFPVDIHGKFGFSPPVGLYADSASHRVLADYLGEASVAAFQSQLRNLDEVSERLTFHDEHPDLSEEELERHWQHFVDAMPAPPPSDRERRPQHYKAQSRSMGWVVNYLGQYPESYDHVSEAQALEAARRANDWSADL